MVVIELGVEYEGCFFVEFVGVWIEVDVVVIVVFDVDL